MANWNDIQENEVFTDTDGADNVSRIPLKAGQSNTRFDRGVRKDTALTRWNIYTGGGIALRANNQMVTKRDIVPLHSIKFNDYTLDCAYLADGSMVFVGNFTTYDNYPYNRIVILDSNGYVEKTNMNYNDGFNGRVNRVTSMPDGTLWVGGVFSSYTNRGTTISAANFIILNRDMSVSSNFTSGDGLNGEVRSIRLSENTYPSTYSVCIAGEFYTYKHAGSSTTVGKVVRINNNATVKNSGAGITYSGYDAKVLDTATNPDGSVIAVGDFSSVTYTADGNPPATVSRNRMVKLTSTLGFSSDTVAGFNATIRVIKRDAFGYFWVGGFFSVVTNTTGVDYTYKCLVVLESDTRIRIQVADPNIYGAIFDIDFQLDDKALVVGDFMYSVQRYNPVSSNGTRDTSFPYINQFIPSLSEGRIPFCVRAERVLLAPKIILAGAFGGIRNTSDTTTYYTKNAVRLDNNGQYQVPW